MTQAELIDDDERRLALMREADETYKRSLHLLDRSIRFYVGSAGFLIYSVIVVVLFA